MAADLLATWRELGRLLVKWTALSTAAGGVLYSLAVTISELAGDSPAALVWLGFPLAGGMVGVLAGKGQSQLLKPFVPLPEAWVLATAAGWALGVPALVVCTGLLSAATKTWIGLYRLMAFLIAAGGVGAFSGLWQWLLLRARIDRSLWWLLANGVGWLLAWLGVLASWWVIGQGDALPVTSTDFAAVFVLGALAGWMLGVEQGIALVGLIAQRAWEGR